MGNIQYVPKRKFINANEVLLLKTTHGKGHYFFETEVLPKVFATAADAIRGMDDFVQAIRFDVETLIGEDVTEECAATWLYNWDGNPDDKVPPFVDTSDEFKRWCAAYEEENPRWRGPDPDEQRQSWLDAEYREPPMFRHRRDLTRLLNSGERV